MSAPSTGPRSSRLLLVLALVLLGALMALVPHGDGSGDRQGLLAALGFLLLAGTLAGELLEALKLPHLTAYLLTGIVAGPHGLGLVGHHTVEDLTFVNSLALALIALAGGAELRLDILRQELRSVSTANLVHIVVGAPLMALVFYLARPMIPFARSLAPGAVLGVALLWGALAVSRSPSATLALLSQTRAKGPLTSNVLAFIMLSDAVVTVFFALVLVMARPLIDPSQSLSMRELTELGHELIGSVAVGTTMGLLIAAYLRLLGAQLQLMLLVLGFVVWEALRYLRFDALLAFLVAGFVVQNLSRQGDTFLHAVERLSGVVFVLFFTTAGAHLDLPLVGRLWPVALLLCASRAGISFGASKLSGRLSNDAPILCRWSWSALVSQAGLTLGLVVIIERAFPAFGAELRSLAVATVAINEVGGPLLFKFALDRAGEIPAGPPPSRLHPEGEPP